jgi:DNA uptake protein ComE-like DNA-binding protein
VGVAPADMPPPVDAPPPSPEEQVADQPVAEIPPSPEDAAAGEGVSLNNATFEELRDVGLSVTQTGRVLAYRERSGGFNSVDELDTIPGFPKDFLGTIKHRLRP